MKSNFELRTDHTTLKVLDEGETSSTVESNGGKTKQQGGNHANTLRNKNGNQISFHRRNMVTSHNLNYQMWFVNNADAIIIAEADGFAFMMENRHSIQRANVNKIIFLLDSGATDHIVNRENFFSSNSVLSLVMRISVAKMGQSITAIKRGTIQVVTNLGMPGTLEDVFYTPDAAFNLLSVRRMQEKGMRIIF